MQTLIIDNKDSFTFNLVQLLGYLGANPLVLNNQVSLAEIQSLRPSHLLISPGPGTPKDCGVSKEAVLYYAGKIPILGVCLGHQLIGEMYGAKVTKAPYPVHGKTSKLTHNNKGVFRGLHQNIAIARYHSLMVSQERFPDEHLEVTATSEGLIMGIKHRITPHLEGIQFHPESFMTHQGEGFLANFLNS